MKFFRTPTLSKSTTFTTRPQALALAAEVGTGPQAASAGEATLLDPCYHPGTPPTPATLPSAGAPHSSRRSTFVLFPSLVLVFLSGSFKSGSFLSRFSFSFTELSGSFRCRQEVLSSKEVFAILHYNVHFGVEKKKIPQPLNRDKTDRLLLVYSTRTHLCIGV